MTNHDIPDLFKGVVEASIEFSRLQLAEPIPERGNRAWNDWDTDFSNAKHKLHRQATKLSEVLSLPVEKDKK